MGLRIPSFFINKSGADDSFPIIGSQHMGRQQNATDAPGTTKTHTVLPDMPGKEARRE